MKKYKKSKIVLRHAKEQGIPATNIKPATLDYKDLIGMPTKIYSK